MPSLAGSELLDLWAGASSMGPTSRALALMLAARPETDPHELIAMPVGRRDRRLLELRCGLFGSTLEAYVDCPACGARLELEADATTLGAIGQADDKGTGSTESLTFESWTVDFRLPNSRDLAVVEGHTDVGAIRSTLVGAVVSGVSREGTAVAASTLPDGAVQAVGRRMAELDPVAALDVEVDCPECGELWQAPINVADYLWTEIDAWARRTLREVHELAIAYSWTEDQILSLTPARRARYLQLVAG